MSTNKTLVKNNYIFLGQIANNIGIHDFSNRNIHYYNNTVRIEGSNNLNSTALYSNQTDLKSEGLIYKNNLFTNTATKGYCIKTSGHKNSIAKIENNIIHSKVNMIDYFGHTYNNLSNFNNHSNDINYNQNVNPSFVSSSSPNTNVFDKKLITTQTLTDVTHYFDGTVRNPKIDFIGAGLGVKSSLVSIVKLVSTKNSASLKANFLPFDHKITDIKLYYGTNENLLNQTIDFNKTSTDLEENISVEIKNLIPYTKYYYQISYSDYGNKRTSKTNIFTTSIDLENITYHVANKTLLNTTNKIEYSLGNTNVWKVCSNNNTANINFIKGDVKVREIAKPTNCKTLGNITAFTKPNSNEFVIDYENEKIDLNIDHIEYSINGSQYTSISNHKLFHKAKAFGKTNDIIRFRKKADKNHLPSESISLVYPSRRSAPDYPIINYTNETITFNSDAYEYKTPKENYTILNNKQLNISNIIPNHGSPQTTISIRKPANNLTKQFCSDSRTIQIKARSKTPSFTINYHSETIDFLTTDYEYSDQADMNNSKSSNGNLRLNVPDHGKENSDLFIRRKAKANNFKSLSQHISIKPRPQKPIALLQKVIGSQRMIFIYHTIKKKYEKAKASDNLEYFTNAWRNIPNGFIDILGLTKIYIRVKATNNNFKSKISNNLIQPENLKNVKLNVATSTLHNTTSQMSFKYTGDKISINCSDRLTNIICKAGNLEVFETVNPANKIQFIIAPPENLALTLTINYEKEKTNEELDHTYEYKQNINWIDASDHQLVTLNPTKNSKKIWYRKKATADKLASKIKILNIPARSIAPVLPLDISNKKITQFNSNLEYIITRKNKVDNRKVKHLSNNTNYIDISNCIADFGKTNYYVHIRKKAKADAFNSVYTSIKINTKHQDLNPNIDFKNETLLQINQDVDYNFGDGKLKGSAPINQALFSKFIDHKSSNRTLKIQTTISNQYYESNEAILLVPKRPSAPNVKLASRFSTHASFLIFKNGNFKKVITNDHLEYYHSGLWKDILSSTTIDSRGNNPIYVRKKSEGNQFKSVPTKNLNIRLNLNKVGINVAKKQLDQTNTFMQYSINSSNGIDGDWFDCSNFSTKVNVTQPTTVYVREKDDILNHLKILDITQDEAPVILIDYKNEQSYYSILNTMEYALKSDFSDAKNGTNVKIKLDAGNTYYFRYKATAQKLASKVKTINIFDRPVISTKSSDLSKNQSHEIEVDFKRNVSNFKWHNAILENAELSEFKVINHQKYKMKITARKPGKYSIKYNANIVNEKAYKSNQLKFTFQPVIKQNNQPTINTSLKDVVFNVNNPINFKIDINNFSDLDNDNLSFHSVKLASGQELPSWLKFDKSNGNFSGFANQTQELTISVKVTDGKNGYIETTFNLKVKMITSIQTINQTTKLLVYPNPCYNEIQIKGTIAGKRIEIFNLAGKKMISKQTNHTTTRLNLSTLATGLYLLKVNTSKGSETFKIYKGN